MNYQERQKQAFIALDKMKEAMAILNNIKSSVPTLNGEFDKNFDFISKNSIEEEVEIKDFSDAFSALNSAILNTGAYATRQIEP